MPFLAYQISVRDLFPQRDSCITIIASFYVYILEHVCVPRAARVVFVLDRFIFICSSALKFYRRSRRNNCILKESRRNDSRKVLNICVSEKAPYVVRAEAQIYIRIRVSTNDDGDIRWHVRSILVNSFSNFQFARVMPVHSFAPRFLSLSLFHVLCTNRRNKERNRGRVKEKKDVGGKTYT